MIRFRLPPRASKTRGGKSYFYCSQNNSPRTGAGPWLASLPAGSAGAGGLVMTRDIGLSPLWDSPTRLLARPLWWCRDVADGTCTISSRVPSGTRRQSIQTAEFLPGPDRMETVTNFAQPLSTGSVPPTSRRNPAPTGVRGGCATRVQAASSVCWTGRPVLRKLWHDIAYPPNGAR